MYLCSNDFNILVKNINRTVLGKMKHEAENHNIFEDKYDNENK